MAAIPATTGANAGNEVYVTMPRVAAVACFADGPTTIRNVAHIHHKEIDRLAALAAELRRLGAAVHEFADGLTITPRPLHGAEVETYDDHRMAMSLALVGLRVPGVVIKKPGCGAKTYPHCFRDLEQLRSSTETMPRSRSGPLLSCLRCVLCVWRVRPRRPPRRRRGPTN